MFIRTTVYVSFTVGAIKRKGNKSAIYNLNMPLRGPLASPLFGKEDTQL